VKKRACYIVFEGADGVGKTTHARKLADALRLKGFSVLETKEPGTPLAPLTMQLRGIMLDQQYNDSMTTPARELISQAIRSIHLDGVIVPALNQYDFIIQDRGVISGIAYGKACGNNIDDLAHLSDYISRNARKHLPDHLYDRVVYLRGDVAASLLRAKDAKQEFKAGDAMEAKGASFINEALLNMEKILTLYEVSTVDVFDRPVDAVHADVLAAILAMKGLDA
jgi:dTMP kinase